MYNQVAVGKFGSPYGVKGWVKVISFTHPIEKLLEYGPWYLHKGGTQTEIEILQGKVHGHHLVVFIKGCNDREFAKFYTNLEIFIDRAQLPAPCEDEYYWVDLIGLLVVNCQQEILGEVDSLLATGANDVLVVREKSGKERHIPFINDVILKVDLGEKKLTVDWDATF